MLQWLKRRVSKADEPTGTTTNATAPSTAAPAPTVLEIPRDKIAARAAEIWVRKGRPHGQDVQNWTEAEAELRAEFAARLDSDALPRKSR